MELTNEFRVPVPVEQAWAVLTDVERIAPCMPGADLQEIEGDEYRGVVKVKVGPITAQYKGKASFQEKDDSAHRAVLKAEGRDTRGQGNANATITALLQPDGDGTTVRITTDLHLTGKVAQFGRGVLADVSGKLISQFVDCLHADVLNPARETPTAGGDGAGSEEGTAPQTSQPQTPQPQTSQPQTPPAAQADQSGPTIRKIESGDVAPVDLLETAGAPIAKRLAPLVAILFVATWLLRRRRRRRRA